MFEKFQEALRRQREEDAQSERARDERRLAIEDQEHHEALKVVLGKLELADSVFLPSNETSFTLGGVTVDAYFANRSPCFLGIRLGFEDKKFSFELYHDVGLERWQAEFGKALEKIGAIRSSKEM